MGNEARADWADKDFYAVLGLKKDASAEEIKKAYRKLARANHPDSNPGDTAKHDRFKQVAEAYDVVGDPERRKTYDEFRRAASMGGFGGGFGGGRGRTGTGAGGFDISDLLREQAGQGGFGDMFGDLFTGGAARGGGRARTRPQRGSDMEATTSLSFDDAMSGATVSLRLQSDAPCTACQGTGGKPGTTPHICTQCDGAGFVVANSGGAFAINETCPACGGRQLVYDEPCGTCRGTGHGTSSRTVQARIPAGVRDGAKIRLKGKGGAGSGGGPAGDLFVNVKVAPHRLFGRKGDNLTLDVPVSFDEAALGAQVKIPTLNGPAVMLKVPAGTPSGRTFRVRGKGATRADGTRGDLLATIEVQVPAHLPDGAREAVEAYRAAMAGTPMRTRLFEGA